MRSFKEGLWANKERGFTLVEVVLIIVIVAVLVAAVNIGISNLNAIRLSNAVGKVVADLRYTQQLSATTRSRHGLTIDSLQQYSGHIDNAGVNSPIKDPTNLGPTFVVNFDVYQQQQLNGVRFASATPFCTGPPGCAACTSTIEFDTLGIPTNDSGTPLCSVSLVLTRSGAANQTVTIEANTGKIN